MVIYMGCAAIICGSGSRLMLERLGLGDRARDRVETLSGGLRRRTELAKALLHQPELLLLDEPSTGLDPGARREFNDYLAHLRRVDGVTIVLTTHYMEEAERCDRIAIMHEGRMVAMAPPGELKEQIGGDVVVVRSIGDPAASDGQDRRVARAQERAG